MQNDNRAAEATRELDRLTAAAAAAVSAFEATPLGEPFAGALDEAIVALEAAELAATSIGFPDSIQPIAPAALATFQQLAAHVPVASGPAGLAHIHRLFLDGWPEAAALTRGPIGRLWLGELQSVYASRLNRARDAGSVGADGRVQFTELASAQVLARDPDCAWARFLAETLPALGERFVVAADAHEAHRALELAKREAEEADRVAAVASAERRRREDLREFFLSRCGQPFILAGRVVYGQALDRVIRGVEARDAEGTLLRGVTVEQLDVLRAKTEAAERVVEARR
jgi:hypothetical protein